MKLHEIKAKISEIAGLAAHDDNDCVCVTVTGDTPEMVGVVRGRLQRSGIAFTESKHRKFKGAFFSIPVRNVGSAHHANWEFA